jgi:hypothetical protein
MQKQVLPRFGDAPLRAIINSGVQQWVSDDQRSLGRNDPEGSLRTLPVFNAAIADNRLQFNPALAVPLGTIDALWHVSATISTFSASRFS